MYCHVHRSNLNQNVGFTFKQLLKFAWHLPTFGVQISVAGNAVNSIVPRKHFHAGNKTINHWDAYPGRASCATLHYESLAPGVLMFSSGRVLVSLLVP